MQYQHLYSVVALFLIVCAHLKKETKLVFIPRAFHEGLTKSSLVEVVPVKRNEVYGNTNIKVNGGVC